MLTAESNAPEQGRSEPLNSILFGYMQAIWLVMDHDSAWLDDLPASWWQRWTWYILRELRPNLMEEQQEPKAALLCMVHDRATAEVRTAVEELATRTDFRPQDLLTSLLDLFDSVDDAVLDQRLCDGLAAGKIPDDRVGDVANFLLARDGSRALSACLSRFEPEAIAEAEQAAVCAAVALLQHRTRESWGRVFELLQRRPDLASRVLGEFAYEELREPQRRDESSEILAPTTAQMGRLTAFLLEAFPPEQDPKHDRARILGPDEAARRKRDELISGLGGLRDMEAIETLRALEQRFASRYPWLRRPRARVERSYRLSNWTPVPPRTVAELLVGAKKRLIRSDCDAVEGIIAAIEQYATRLRHASPSRVEVLWNRPKKGRPTPKEEEWVSDRLCDAIRDYFRDYAVTADREVQIFRRKLPRDVGGAPGSEVDVLCRVPAVGVANGDAIAVPIEVKLSHNPEARTGLREQLVNRYVSQLGTNVGVFVVAWMGTPKPSARYRPLWDSPTTAQEELTRQALDVTSSSEGLDIRAIVIDASLPSSPRTLTGRKKTMEKVYATPPNPKGDSSGRNRKSAATVKKSSKTTGTKKKPVTKRTTKKAIANKKQQVKRPAAKKKRR